MCFDSVNFSQVVWFNVATLEGKRWKNYLYPILHIFKQLAVDLGMS